MRKQLGETCAYWNGGKQIEVIYFEDEVLGESGIGCGIGIGNNTTEVEEEEEVYR